MKICIDASAARFYRDTGIGAYVSELLYAFREGEYGSEIDVFDSEKVLPLKETSLFPGVTDTSFWETTRFPPKDGKRYDIIHNPHNGIGTGGTPALVTLHDVIPLISGEYCGSPYRELFLKEVPRAVADAPAVITVSENSKRDIMATLGVESERIFVIYEGPKHYCRPLPLALTENYLRSRYDLKRPFFLYAGGFNERKNVGGLLNAYAAVYRDFPVICPLIILGGRDRRRDKLETLRDDLGLRPYARFIGGVSEGELPFFYSAATALIYPSFYEGFGLPPLEAAACRTAVISADNSSLREVMADGALYGKAEDPLSFGEHMLRLLKDPTFCRNAEEKAFCRSAAFSFADTAKKTRAVYERCCR